METVNIKINGKEYAVPQGSTVLEAARAAKNEIPVAGKPGVPPAVSIVVCTKMADTHTILQKTAVRNCFRASKCFRKMAGRLKLA